MHFFQRTRSTITQFTHLKLQDFFSFFGLEIIAKSGSLREREISVEVLALLSKDKSIPNLVKILKNDNYTYVKARVILALIFLKRIDGIKECFLLLEREKNPNNLKKYFEALDSYHNVKILPTLLKIAYTDNQYLFSWIGKTLTKYGDTALNRLISKMRAQTISDKRKTVRL